MIGDAAAGVRRDRSCGRRLHLGSRRPCACVAGWAQKWGKGVVQTLMRQWGSKQSKATAGHTQQGGVSYPHMKPVLSGQAAKKRPVG
jgi:hypothetical protein